jgi:RHS repeat-associated protein
MVTYVYDAFGNRIEEEVWNGSTTTVTEYGVDGWGGAATSGTSSSSAAGAARFNDWVTLNGTGAVQARQLFGSGLNQPMASISSSGSVSWYLTDYEGSVVQTLNNAGASIATTTYSALGVSSGSTPSPYGFQGMQWDGTLGLYYDNARMYDPSLGRFLSEDPLGFAANPNGNLYSFVGNDPTAYTDPSGLQPQTARQSAGGGNGNGNGNGGGGGGAATGQGPGGSTITAAGFVPFPPVGPGQTVFSPGKGGLWRVRKTPIQTVPPGGGQPQPDPNYDPRYPGGSIKNVAPPKSTFRKIWDGSLAQDVTIGLGQGIANGGNAITDSVIGLANIPGFIYNNTLGLNADLLNFPYIPLFDWS